MLDDATSQFLAGLAGPDTAPISAMTPVQARGLGAALRDLSGPGPELARSSDHLVAGTDGQTFGIRVHSPADPKAVVVYFHGGGWVMGSADEVDTLGRVLAERSGCAVALVDYRLAPEHRFPTAVDDAWAAVLWAHENLADLAGPTAQLVVGGDSAGGNLAAVVAQRARRTGAPAIAGQVLVYPVTDADLDTECYTDPENQLLLDRDTMAWYWDHYAPDHADRARPEASPLRAADLSGLPPAVVLTAEHDVVRDEGEAYAHRLEAAGVPVVLRRFAGQMHGFFTLVNVLPRTSDAIGFVVDELSRVLDQTHAR